MRLHMQVTLDTKEMGRLTKHVATNGLGQAVRTVQFLSVDAVEAAQSGHPGAPMALATIGVEIFSRHLRYVPDAPEWPNRDRFVLSCGHASMLLYALLHLAGYDVPLSEIKQFRQWGSRTPGHPERGVTPGVETTTGPLGQGFGNSVGMALSAKMMAARVNRPGYPLIDYRVFTLASDGDLMEGVSAESASLAGHLALDNLIVVYDDNRITIDGSTDLVWSEDVGRRFEAYGWFVQHVDGHDVDASRAALDAAVAEPARPSLIIARTHIAVGAPTKQDTADAHGSPLGAQEVEAAKRNAGWPLEPFFVGDRAREPFLQQVDKNRREHAAWQARVAGLDAEQAALWSKLCERAVPADLFAELSRAVDSAKADATRSHAGKIEQRAARLVPSLVGGSADLASSAKTTIEGGGDVRAKEYAGRNLHFGVREHAMGAISNGLALSGFFIPFASTFLIFSDYMRPSIRLACLMQRQVVYVFSHDSVFLGEDGPTHQPIEQLWSLRLIPNLDVFRPADALECAAGWTHALLRRSGPTVLSLTRHKVPAIERPSDFDPSRILEGAYVLSDEADAELAIIATGSEVHVAIEAKAILGRRGKRVRVVSAPCLEAFERLPESRREEILGSGRRVTLEAGRTTPWRGVAGPDGICIGIDRFGASAPWQRLAEELGLTAAKVADRILGALALS